MINSWWLAPAVFVGVVIGYIIACFMYVGKLGDNSEKSYKK